MNKLFILDDFGDDKRGCYYLGENLNNNVEECCVELIKRTIKQNRINKVICVGSSKGGWAAINLMLSIPNSDCIIGAPQYKLGDYLMKPKLEVCRKFVMNNCNKKEISYLNNYLREKILKNKNKHNIYIQYSNNEHTYDDHIKFLLKDIRNNNKISLYEEKLEYDDHSKVSQYFPDFLLKVLKENYKER